MQFRSKGLIRLIVEKPFILQLTYAYSKSVEIVDFL